ncbi:MAG: hypothetical protein IRY91_06095 [Gemmatimonadaceae bacterium]|nr:hypothetical protein [Gemmatimonadaceae bacterium]
MVAGVLLVAGVLARIYLHVGDRDRAIARLDAIVGLPYFVSPVWLAIDPELASLRDDSRFRAVVARR